MGRGCPSPGSGHTGTPEPGAPVTGASAGPWHQKCVLTLTQHDGGPGGSSGHQAAERSLPCCPPPHRDHSCQRRTRVHHGSGQPWASSAAAAASTQSSDIRTRLCSRLRPDALRHLLWDCGACRPPPVSVSAWTHTAHVTAVQQCAVRPCGAFSCSCCCTYRPFCIFLNSTQASLCPDNLSHVLTLKRLPHQGSLGSAVFCGST